MTIPHLQDVIVLMLGVPVSAMRWAIKLAIKAINMKQFGGQLGQFHRFIIMFGQTKEHAQVAIATSHQKPALVLAKMG